MSCAKFRIAQLVAATALTLFVTASSGYPSIYPTGTTIYNPDKAWNGYTIHPTPENKGAVLIDMNGNVIRRFEDVPGSPIRILPGGHIMGGSGEAVVQQDWEGNEVWRFDRTEQIKDADGNMVWSSRQHHDWQREGSPAGYFSPLQTPNTDSGRTLILAFKNLTVPEITDKRLRDDYFLEVSWDGEIVWEYINPFFYETDDTRNNFYRAYRVPYEWIPQLTPPTERAIAPLHPSEFRIEPQ